MTALVAIEPAKLATVCVCACGWARVIIHKTHLRKGAGKGGGGDECERDARMKSESEEEASLHVFPCLCAHSECPRSRTGLGSRV